MSDLKEKLTARLLEFIDRAAPLVRDRNGTATLTIMLHQPGGDVDNTLYMEAELEERLEIGSEEGRIEGLAFDVEERS